MLSLIDDTGIHRTEASLRREMHCDSLTGLPNRGGFGDALELAITPETAAQHAVMIVNLNRFSRVNACMGGLTGDEALVSFHHLVPHLTGGHALAHGTSLNCSI